MSLCEMALISLEFHFYFQNKTNRSLLTPGIYRMHKSRERNDSLDRRDDSVLFATKLWKRYKKMMQQLMHLRLGMLCEHEPPASSTVIDRVFSWCG
jgi:hypothetical protein